MNSIIEMLGWVGSVFIFAGLWRPTNGASAFFLYLVWQCALAREVRLRQRVGPVRHDAALAVLAAYGYYAWGAAERTRRASERTA
jgi:hypothetical protein